jgi:uncharacterized protein YndB with AHSA1/START domain
MSDKTERRRLSITLPSDREIVMTRVFDAPRTLVFEAHTKVEHLQHWWGGNDPGSRLECELDFRTGGRYRFVEYTANGEEHAFRGEFREIVAPERIVQTFEYEPMAGHIAVETLVFEEHDGKTTLTTTSLFQSRDDRDGMIDSGMEQGANTSMDRLEDYLNTLA